MPLKGKTIILGVTGGIAAYKSAMLCSLLVKSGAQVHVIMTKNACEFIAPLTFETLSSNRVSVETFDRNFEWNVQHISLAKKADAAVVAPATANIIAKMANGIADDMLSTTLLACTCPKLVATAMNTGMFLNTATQRNMKCLEDMDIKLIHGAEGILACNDVGKGRMAEPAEILEKLINIVAYEKDLAGKNIIVTAGATREALDPVRYITNHSSGKMGYEIAKAAVARGGNVTLISGKTSLQKPMDVNFIEITSAKDMHDAVTKHFPHCDMLIKAAAVADYTPKVVAEEKIKKKAEDGMSIELMRTVDILKSLKEQNDKSKIVCGFSMETENLVENSTKKLTDKCLDMVVANSLKTEGAGFGVDSNIITIITKESAKEYELMSKQKAAHTILDELLKL